MGRPRKKIYTLKEKIQLVKAAGLEQQKPPSPRVEGDDPALEDLSARIKHILNIFRDRPIKSIEMISLIMYDIEDNKVRHLIAKYLKEKGCLRIQKSVYIAKLEKKVYYEIVQTLKEIQECYDNKDSIIMVPIPHSTPGSMQIIGKDIQIDTLVNKPNTLIF